MLSFTKLNRCFIVCTFLYVTKDKRRPSNVRLLLVFGKLLSKFRLFGRKHSFDLRVVDIIIKFISQARKRLIAIKVTICIHGHFLFEIRNFTRKHIVVLKCLPDS